MSKILQERSRWSRHGPLAAGVATVFRAMAAGMRVVMIDRASVLLFHDGCYGVWSTVSP